MALLDKIENIGRFLVGQQEFGHLFVLYDPKPGIFVFNSNDPSGIDAVKDFARRDLRFYQLAEKPMEITGGKSVLAYTTYASFGKATEVIKPGDY